MKNPTTMNKITQKIYFDMKLKLLELREVKSLIITCLSTKNDLLERLLSEKAFKIPTIKAQKKEDVDISQLLKEQMACMN
jgi:hypothetical protein